jgi:hypothetical protein
MRPAAIAVTGAATLLLIFAFDTYVQVAFLLLSTSVCLATLAGFLVERRGERNFWVAMGRQLEREGLPVPPNTVVKIEGRNFLVDSLPERLEFIVTRKNCHMIIAIALIALGGVIASLSAPSLLAPQLDADSPRHLQFLGLCYLLAIFLFVGITWFAECTLLRNPGVTLANVVESGVGRRVIYQFNDPSGGYHGGTAMNFGGPQGDNLKVVFCSHLNFGVSKLSCGLVFHSVVWKPEKAKLS